MQIANPKRKKQIKEFVDKDHKVMSKYYELLDDDISEKKLMKEMRRLIEEDKDFYDPYLIVADILFWNGKEKEGEAMLKDAYEWAINRIADYKGRWPKEMAWGYLENRHLMRAIEQYGILCWELGNIDEALDIFRRLLRMNPGDNQGMRHNILAIRMGLGVDEWQKPFEIKERGEVAGLDAIKVNNWFETNAKKFPEEFGWLVEGKKGGMRS